MALQVEVLSNNIESEIPGVTALKGTVFQALTSGATIAITIKQPYEVNVCTWTAAHSPTITVTGGVAGQELVLIMTSDGSTRTITWSTGFATVASTNAGTASKITTARFLHDGTSFKQIGSVVTLA